MVRLIVLALVLVALAPAVQAQVGPPERFITPVSDWRDLRSEPNVNQPGHIRSPAWNGGTDYPADANGIADAKEGVPTRILDVQAMSGCTPFQACTFPALLEPFAGSHQVGHYIRWRALYGDWADLNGDGYVQDAELEAERVQANPLVAAAAESGDEFTGVAGATIVAYYEPGNWSYASKPGAPDFTFEDRGGGFYLHNNLLFGTPFPDDYGLVRTTVIEAISSPILTPDGRRDYEAGPGSRVDVDVYQTVDPTLEALFSEAWGDYGLSGITGPIVADVQEIQRDGRGATYQHYGPTYAAILPPHENENGQRDDYASGSHAWFDAEMAFPRWYYSGIVTSNHYHGDPPERRPGLGEYRPLGYASIFARFGVWHDENGDGWIGAPRDDWPGCEGDATGCGALLDPNDYDGRNDDNSPNSEFTRACPSYNNALVNVLVDVWPNTPDASWGLGGVYVVRDDEGQGSHRNIYDDIVRDVEDLNPQRYVTHGTITMTVRCDLIRQSEGRMTSDEGLVFPGGMVGYDLHVVARPTNVNFNVGAVDLDEVISDTDLVRGWNV